MELIGRVGGEGGLEDFDDLMDIRIDLGEEEGNEEVEDVGWMVNRKIHLQYD